MIMLNEFTVTLEVSQPTNDEAVDILVNRIRRVLQDYVQWMEEQENELHIGLPKSIRVKLTVGN